MANTGPKLMMSLLVATFLSLLVVGDAQSIKSSMFVQEEMCDLEESINRGCSKEAVRGTRSILECSILCWLDTECVGAGLDARGRCLHHQLCHFSVPCPGGPDAVRHLYMAPYCLHGTWDSSIKSCVCRYETFGARCNEYYNFCDNLTLSGYENGGYWTILDPLDNGRDFVKVLCRVKKYTGSYYSSVRLVLKSDRSNFNRTWEEYVNGFMIDEQNFWTGLKTWHILGKAGLRHLDLCLKLHIGDRVLASYNDFLVLGKNTNYSFVSSSKNFSSINFNKISILENATEGCISSLKGVPFSTWNKDNDGDERGENCASLAGSGWWYDELCGNPCHLFGWGRDNNGATPLAQRLTFLGVDMTNSLELIRETRIEVWKDKN